MGKTIDLTAADGHRLNAYVAEPAAVPRAAVIVVQEIFGVNSHIRSVADGYATAGYLAIAPAMFDRVERNYETGYAPAEIERGRDAMQKIGWDQAMADVGAALGVAKKTGKVGIVGYCWGGTVSWRGAANTSGLACSAPYYGGGMPNFKDEKPKIPTLCHFGELDQSPTPAQAKELLAKHPGVEGHFYGGAGHGFNCDQRGSYNAEAAKLARERTVAFFKKHIG
jgi:carboxymethylenebutenolidase